MSTTPLKGGVGISKTLLTPCRRVGLSRKFKSTPTSSPTSKPAPTVSPAPVLSKPSKPQVKEDATKSREPVKEVKKSQNDLVENFAEIPTHRKDNKEAQKSQEPKDAKISQNEKGAAETPPTHRKEKETQKRSSRRKMNVQPRECVVVINKSEIDEKLEKENLNNDLQKSNRKEKLSGKLNSIQNETVEASKPLEEKPANNHDEKLTHNKEGVKNQPDEETPKDSNKTNPERKLTKRCLSMKKTSSHVDLLEKDDLLSTSQTSLSTHITNDFLDECNINSEDPLMDCSDSEELIKVKSSRKRHITSSDEDDFVVSQGSSKSVQDETQKINWQEKVREIQARIRQKEAHLNELKQATVYRKLHDIEVLQRVTEMWERCCKESLVYLLPKLQDHVEIDMYTLMRKLDVPDCIVYDSESSSFK